MIDKGLKGQKAASGEAEPLAAKIRQSQKLVRLLPFF